MDKILVNSDEIVPLDLVFETFFPNLSVQSLINLNTNTGNKEDSIKTLCYIKDNYLDIMKSLTLKDCFNSFISFENIKYSTFSSISSVFKNYYYDNFDKIYIEGISSKATSIYRAYYLNEIIFKINSFTYIIKNRENNEIKIRPLMFLGIEKDLLYLFLSEISFIDYNLDLRHYNKIVYEYLRKGLIKVYYNDGIKSINKISFFKNITSLSHDFVGLSENEINSIFIKNKNLVFKKFTDLNSIKEFSFEAALKNIALKNSFELI